MYLHFLPQNNARLEMTLPINAHSFLMSQLLIVFVMINMEIHVAIKIIPTLTSSIKFCSKLYFVKDIEIEFELKSGFKLDVW